MPHLQRHGNKSKSTLVGWRRLYRKAAARPPPRGCRWACCFVPIKHGGDDGEGAAPRYLAPINKWPASKAIKASQSSHRRLYLIFEMLGGRRFCDRHHVVVIVSTAEESAHGGELNLDMTTRWQPDRRGAGTHRAHARKCSLSARRQSSGELRPAVNEGSLSRSGFRAKYRPGNGTCYAHQTSAAPIKYLGVTYERAWRVSSVWAGNICSSSVNVARGERRRRW